VGGAPAPWPESEVVFVVLCAGFAAAELPKIADMMLPKTLM